MRLIHPRNKVRQLPEKNNNPPRNKVRQPIFDMFFSMLFPFFMFFWFRLFSLVFSGSPEATNI